MFNFGLNGRLCNQFFQLAALYSASKRLGTNIFLFERTNSNASNYETIDDLMNFKVKTIDNCSWVGINEYQQLYKNNIKKTYQETQFEYNRDFENVTNQTNFSGYFQTEKYFKNYKTELTNIFSLTKKTNLCLKYENLIKNNKFVSIHVRRTDYIAKSNFHSNLSNTNYYYDAIDKFIETTDIKFLIFSDDILFCKEYFKNYRNNEFNDRFIFVEGTTGPEEVHLQSLCFANIIANSSFSWWGAWLNKNNNLTIAPKTWFGPAGPPSFEDIYCENWIKM